MLTRLITAICNRGAADDEGTERTEPVMSSVPPDPAPDAFAPPAPAQTSMPFGVVTVAALEPELEPEKEPEKEKEMTKKIFIAVPDVGTPQSISTAKSLAEQFCRALYSASGVAIEVVHYIDLDQTPVACKHVRLGQAARVFQAAMDCDAAFFSAGCEQDPFLEVIRSRMDACGTPYHSFTLHNA